MTAPSRPTSPSTKGRSTEAAPRATSFGGTPNGWRAALAANRKPLLAALALAAGVVVAPTGLPIAARLTLGLFLVLVALTSFSTISEVGVCGAVLAGLVVVGGSSVGDVATAATGGTVWLLIGAFIVAAAARTSGIAERLALLLGSRATTVGGLFWLLTAGVLATAFLVPSTAGRAALLLPVYLAVAERLQSDRARRALSILIPGIVLMTAVATLFGASANLVTSELVASLGNEPFGLVEWTLYGLPFAAASSLLTTWVILRLFLTAEDRRTTVALDRPTKPWSRSERIVASTIGVMIVLWLSEPIHGVEAWVVALIGGAAVLVGPLAIVSIAEARSAVPLDLLILLVVTAEAGAALARTGAADWIATSLLGPVMDGRSPMLAIVALIAAVALVAHLVISSRTARAAVLIPVVLIVAGAAGLDPRALAFLATAAAGYCLTTTTSAKPIRVFAAVEGGYTPADLRRLSLRLLPVHLLLLLGFGFVAWPALGLSLDGGDPRDEASQRAFPWSGVVIEDLGVGPRWQLSPNPESFQSEPDELAPGSADSEPATITPDHRSRSNDGRSESDDDGFEATDDPKPAIARDADEDDDESSPLDGDDEREPTATGADPDPVAADDDPVPVAADADIAEQLDDEPENKPEPDTDSADDDADDD